MTQLSEHLDDELLVAHVLGETDGSRRDGIDAHLEGCADCRREYVGLIETLGTLSYAAPSVSPPDGLRTAILDAAAREPRAGSALAPRAARRGWSWPTWFPRFALVGGLAGLAVVVAVVLIATPAPSRSVPLEGSSGVVLVSDHRAALVPTGFSPAPPGRTYEMWVLRNGVAHPAGLFASGASLAAVTVPVDPGDIVAVTREPAGGSPQPTTIPIAHAQI
jgi:hypothetical protein